MILLALAILVGSVVSASARDALLWLTAMQAYVRQEYAAAHTAYTQVLAGPLTATEREACLWQDADCLQHLGREAEVIGRLEALVQCAPNSPYLKQGLPVLYRGYLHTGAQQKADAIWQDCWTRWRTTPFIWDLVQARLEMTAARAPDQVPALAEQIVQLPVGLVPLTLSVYRPVLSQRAYAAATALHVRLHALLAKQDPALAELDQQAYDACWSRQLVEAMFQRFKTELDAGRLDAAAQALDELNLTVPESPDAERARKLYREKVTQPPKE